MKCKKDLTIIYFLCYTKCEQIIICSILISVLKKFKNFNLPTEKPVLAKDWFIILSAQNSPGFKRWGLNWYHDWFSCNWGKFGLKSRYEV